MKSIQERIAAAKQINPDWRENARKASALQEPASGVEELRQKAVENAKAVRSANTGANRAETFTERDTAPTLMELSEGHFGKSGFTANRPTAKNPTVGMKLEAAGDRLQRFGEDLFNLDKVMEENHTGEKIDAAVKSSPVGSTILNGLSKFNAGAANTAALPFRLANEAGVDEKYLPVLKWAESKQNINNDFAKSQQDTTSKHGKVGEILGDVGAGTVSAIPSAVLSVLSGGASTISQLAPQASGVSEVIYRGLQEAVKNPQYWTTFLNTIGDDYQAAKDAGGNAGEALVSALGSSLVNAGIEVGGGVETLPEQLRSGSANKWVTWLKSGLEEAEEEPAQNVVTQAFQKLFVDRNKKVFSTSDQNAVFNPVREGQSAAMAGASGLLLGLGQLTAVNGRRAGAEGISQDENTDAVAAQAADASQETQNAGYDPNAKVDPIKLLEGLVGEQTPYATQLNIDNAAQNAYSENSEVNRNGAAENAGAGVSERSGSSGNYSEQQSGRSDGSGNTGISENRVLVDPVTAKAMDESGVVNLGLQESTGDNAAYSSALGSAIASNPKRGKYVDPHTAEELNEKGTRTFLSSDRMAGFAIDPDGNITGVFNNADATKRGASPELIITAVANGGTKLDCYVDGNSKVNLSNIYEQLGFVPTGWMKFDPKYVEGWDTSVSGEPIVVFWKLNGDTASEIASKQGTYHHFTMDEIQSLPEYSGENGYTDGLKARDALLQTQSPETQSVGAAEEGFTGRGMEGEEKTSRVGDTLPYNGPQRDATALGKDDYDAIWRYRSQTEERSQDLADELLYYKVDGKRTFLKDVDEDAFRGITDSLKDATAWNGPQTDAAYMIQSELQGRSANGDITETEYVDWLKTMREHATATGQGVQANAKWSRTDNAGGSSTELDAWDNLQNGNLPEDEKKATFRKIVDFDSRISSVTDGDTNAMKEIILGVADERGTLTGITGKQSGILRSVASNALDSLSYEQLQNMAYASTSALSTDSTPVGLGQKLKTVQILSMLSSPRTAAKNLAGNTTFYGLDALAMKGASVLDMALSNVTGTRSVAFERAALGKSSVSDGAQAMRMAIAEITLDVDMDGESSRYGTASNTTFKASGSFLDRVMHAVERNQAYLLNATDEFYKGQARGTADATQALIDAGKIRTDNADYAAEQADQLAKYRTFQDDSRLSVAIQQLHDVLNLAGVGDSGKEIKGKSVKAFGLGDLVAPFTKVAGNLASRGLDYSPINMARGVVEIAQNIAQASGGDVRPEFQAKGVSDFARGMTGTAIAAGSMALAKAGLLRKADDENDKDVQAQNQAEGMTGVQLNLDGAKRYLSGGSAEWQKGDTLVDLSSIEPMNLLLNLGTEMADSGKSPIVSAFTGSVGSFAQSAEELPVLQSVGNFSKDVFRYGQDWKEAAAQQLGSTMVSSLVPNVVRAAAKVTDDRPRQLYSGGTTASYLTDSFKNSIPGLRETLPGSVDGFGNAKTYAGTDISA